MCRSTQCPGTRPLAARFCGRSEKLRGMMHSASEEHYALWGNWATYPFVWSRTKWRMLHHSEHLQANPGCFLCTGSFNLTALSLFPGWKVDSLREWGGGPLWRRKIESVRSLDWARGLPGAQCQALTVYRKWEVNGLCAVCLSSLGLLKEGEVSSPHVWIMSIGAFFRVETCKRHYSFTWDYSLTSFVHHGRKAPHLKFLFALR